MGIQLELDGPIGLLFTKNYKKRPEFLERDQGFFATLADKLDFI